MDPISACLLGTCILTSCFLPCFWICPFVPVPFILVTEQHSDISNHKKTYHFFNKRNGEYYYWVWTKYGFRLIKDQKNDDGYKVCKETVF